MFSLVALLSITNLETTAVYITKLDKIFASCLLSFLWLAVQLFHKINLELLTL